VTSFDDLRALAYLIRRFIKPYWKYTVVLVALSLVSAVLASVQPLVIAPVMDVTLLSRTGAAASWKELTLNNLGASVLSIAGLRTLDPLSLIVFTLIAYVSVAIVASLLLYGSYLMSAWVATSAHRDLQIAMSSQLMSLSMSFFVRQRTGDLISRVTNDTSEAVNVLDLSLRKILQSGVQMAVYGLMLFQTDSRLAVATVAVSLLHLGVTRVLRDRLRRHIGERFDALADVSSRLQESMLSIRVVKSFAAEAFESRRFGEACVALQHRAMQYMRNKHAEEPLRAIADAAAIGVVLMLAFRSLQTGRLNMTGFVLFVYLARQTIAPAALFAQSVLGLQIGLGAACRVLEVLRERPQLVDGSRPVPPLIDAVRLESVTFEYERGRPVLDGIDLEVHKGELIAIVGPSGAGKSTLADLLLRLYDPTAGRVTLDGVNVKEFRQDEYRRLFGVVSQECLLFNGTIRDNIAYAEQHPSDDAIVRAAQIANAAEFIEQLSDGYDTVVGDRGIRLSGGQRQRIAIARAVFASPSILVLDEATSSLDTESERLVQVAIDRVLEQATAVVIAHRLSTIIRANRIVVLHKGRIEAVGPHAMLLRTSPVYRRLHDLQFAHPEAQAAQMGTVGEGLAQ